MKLYRHKAFHKTLAIYFYVWNILLCYPALSNVGQEMGQLAAPSAAPEAPKLAAPEAALPSVEAIKAVPTLDAHALPQNPVVQSGDIVITQPSQGMMHIQQGSQNANIDWDNFNIGSQAHVHFEQPSSSAIAINRVVGQEMSQIFGKLTSTGRVFLINPNGILMGKDVVVDVNSLLLSTNNLSPQDMQKGFDTGKFTFAHPEGAKAAGIINEGTITVAEAGIASFVAPHMRHSGLIQGNLSKVVLAAGETVTIDLYGDKLVNLAVLEKPVSAENAPHNKKPLIEQTGSIITDGGTVLLTAQAVRGIVDNTINNDGVINASSAHVEGGKIVLDGGQEGKVVSNNTLDASSAEGKGGTVKVLAGTVEVNKDVKADGPQGGGEILIGGNKQGLGPEYNAKTTKIAKDAILSANGSEQGDGGKVIVWADHIAHFYGSIEASGKNGGFAEISAKEAVKRSQYIFEPTKINLLGKGGKPGELLLDPHNIIISNVGVDAYNGNHLFTDNSAVDVDISPGTLNVVAGSITLQANTDITITNAIDLTTPSASFLAQAGRSIIANNTIQTPNANITMQANSLGAIGANRDAGAAVLQVNADIIAGSGIVNLAVGGAFPGFLAGDLTGAGIIFTTSTLLLKAAGGNINLTGANEVSALDQSISQGTFTFNNSVPLTIVGAVTSGDNMTINNSNQAITVNAPLNAGAATVGLTGGNISGSGGITAETLTMDSVASNITNAAITNLGASQATGGDFSIGTTGALTLTGLVHGTSDVIINVNGGASPITINAMPTSVLGPRHVFIYASNYTNSQPNDFVLVPTDLNPTEFSALTCQQRQDLLINGGYEFFMSGDLFNPDPVAGKIEEVMESDEFNEPAAPHSESIKGSERLKGLVTFAK